MKPVIKQWENTQNSYMQYEVKRLNFGYLMPRNNKQSTCQKPETDS